MAYLFSLGMLPALVAGAIKYPKMMRADRPFVWIMALNFLSETSQFVRLSIRIGDFTVYNLYVLLFLLLFLYQFYSWKSINKPIAIALAVMGTAVWIWEHLVPEYHLRTRTQFFRMTTGVILFSVAAFTLTRLATGRHLKLFTNHRFYICLALFLYFSFYVYYSFYHIYTDAFLEGSRASENYLRSLASIQRYIMHLTYVLYFVAALWIPRKKNFFSNFS